MFSPTPLLAGGGDVSARLFHATRECSSAMPTPPRPTEKDSVFLLCDIQETFRAHIHNMPRVIAVAKFMQNAAKCLGIPVIGTEQQPFKPTVAEIDTSATKMYSKTKFSMVTDEVKRELEKHRPNSVYIYGIETHVCVLQTVLELLRLGYRVYVVADGVSSIRVHDRAVAIERLAKAGAVLTTAESCVYELMGDASHPAFKACLPHVKELAAFLKAEKTEESKL